MLSKILVSVATKQQLTPLEAACGPTPVDKWCATAAARLGRAFAGLRLRRHLSFDAHHGADADAERLGNLVQTVALA